MSSKNIFQNKIDIEPMNNGHPESVNLSTKFTEEEQINEIRYHFKKIMEVLGLDLDNDSLKDTPERVAKMYVKEIFRGLKPQNKPDVTAFSNNSGYEEMLVEKDITLYSYCAHHFVPIIGRVHVAYLPVDEIIGLSKINRLVDYVARKPQVQEDLTVEVGETLKEILNTENVAVVVVADHLCVASRGIKDTNSSTQTSYLSGKFKEKEYREEFMKSLP